MNHIPIGLVRGILALLLTITTPLASALAVCDGVVAIPTNPPSLNVRSAAGLSGPLLGSVPNGTQGRLEGVNTTAIDGYLWWQVHWMNGLVGWSASMDLSPVEHYMEEIPPPGLVYIEDIIPGWCHLPWSQTTVNPKSTIKRSGTYGIKTTTAAQWGRLYLKTNGKSLSGINSLYFSIRSDSGSGANVWVALQKADGTAYGVYKSIAEYVPGGTMIPGAWYDVRIPRADLGVTQSNTVYGVVFQNLEPATFYADDIALETASGSTKWNPAPTVTGVSVTCTPATITVNQATPCSALVSGTGNISNLVTWSANTGAMNTSGLFAAPQSPTTATITATSVSDPSKSGSTTVNVVQASQAGAIVYSETIGWGWDVGTWSGLTTNPASPIAYRGTNAIEMKTVGQYRRLPLITEPAFRFNTAGYQALSFAINIGAYENEDLYVGLLDAGGSIISYQNIKTYAENSVLNSYQWKHIRIPLTALGAANTIVSGVEIQSINSTTVHVDEVAFEPNGTNGGCQ